ncbi:MAG: hypothetical protein R3E10_14455 [Gemmatimonadota bacterium]
MSEPAAERPRLTDDQAVLRAKYYDFCSARLAGLLLSLSPDEIFVLAEESGVEAGGPLESPYDAMVRRATVMLARRVGLPTYEAWAQAYAEDPTRFEGELIGLWQSEPEAPANGTER